MTYDNWKARDDTDHGEEPPVEMSELDECRDAHDALIQKYEALLAAVTPFVQKFRETDDPGRSDLYDEQPLSLHVNLGHWRRLERLWRAS